MSPRSPLRLKTKLHPVTEHSLVMQGPSLLASGETSPLSSWKGGLQKTCAKSRRNSLGRSKTSPAMNRSRVSKLLAAAFSLASAASASSISMPMIETSETRDARHRLAVPAPAPSSNISSPAPAGTAAASITASRPARNPPCIWRTMTRPPRNLSSVVVLTIRSVRPADRREGRRPRARNPRPRP